MARAGRTTAATALALAIVAGVAVAGFGGPQTVTVGEGPVDVEIGRVNKGKRADVVVTSRTAGVVSVLRGRASGMGAPQPIAFPGDPNLLALGKIDRGRRLDMLVSDVAQPNRAWMLLQRRNGTFKKRSLGMRIAVGDVGLGDLNDDGRTDLVAVTSLSPATVAVRIQRRNGRFFRAFLKPAGDAVGGDPQRLAVGDLNRDGRADVAVTDRLQDEVNVLYAMRHGLRDRKQLPAGASPEGVEIGRANPNKTVDLVVANRGGGSVSVFNGKRNGKLRSAIDYPVGATLLSDVAIGEVNGGRPDLVVTADFMGSFAVLPGQPGGFGPAQFLAAPIGIGALAVGQVNGSGPQDFAAASFSDDSVTAYFGG